MTKQTNESDKSFNYQLLGRLQSDCEYFLGNGNGYEKHLWAGNVKDQIAKMKELWNGFPKSEKPEWLSMEQIEKYEKDMLAMNESGDMGTLPTINEMKTLERIKGYKEKRKGKKISLNESIKETSASGLYAILHDGTTDGDGSSLSAGSDTAIPYEKGNTLEALKNKASELDIYDYELEEVEGAWIVDNKTIEEIDDLWEECNYGNDSEIYYTSNMAKEIAKDKSKENINEAGGDESFNYRLLGRLQADCEYFLGNGNGYEKHLWAGNVKDQIAKMKELWNEVPEKPEWLSMEEIEKYEKDMLAMV